MLRLRGGQAIPASEGTSENREREDDCRSDSMEGVGEAIGRSDRRSQPFRRREGLFHGLSGREEGLWVRVAVALVHEGVCQLW